MKKRKTPMEKLDDFSASAQALREAAKLKLTLSHSSQNLIWFWADVMVRVRMVENTLSQVRAFVRAQMRKEKS